MSGPNRTALEKALLNDYQRGFPLCPHPFQVLAEQLGAGEGDILSAFRRLQDGGVVSRVGPVFRPNTVGASTLAAVSAPASRIEAAAARISAFPEVSHNYEREHRFNLWFVVNAASVSRREEVLSDIAAGTGLGVMSLPLVRDYYIDLGFEIDFGTEKRGDSAGGSGRPAARACGTVALRAEHGGLVPVLQRGLPIVHAPYAAVGAGAGLSEAAVIGKVAQMLRRGTIKRFGVVVRHHELGYRANAMCVWDVADDKIDETGRRLADVPFVTLCYRRPRQLPHWPYNLFCMIHGRDRDTVLGQVEQVNRRFGLTGLRRDVLFSGRRFKQRGAVYGAAAPDVAARERAACG